MEPDCRVLTWNVWWRFGDWERRRPLIADVVAHAGADVIALQETWRNDDASQAHELAERAALPHVAWSANQRSATWRDRIDERDSSLECGVAILSRWPIIGSEEQPLPSGRWPPGGRTALGVVVDHPRGPLPVVTTHLDPHPARSALRVEQLAAVASLTARLARSAGSLAPIVCGDMNAEPDSDEIRRFAGVLTAPFVEDLAFFDAWRDAGDHRDPGWTWRRDNPNVAIGNPNARIDHIFVGLRGRVLGVRLVGHEGEAALASDHAGVLADVKP